jgi:ferrochelatase
MSDSLEGKKIAIVLFNLGGPDNLQNVKSFLFNLFYDPSIITLPNPFRFFIAKLISSRREKTAQEIYKKVGGKSPIIEQTESQKEALSRYLNGKLDCNFKVFICMRHWHPKSDAVVKLIKDYNPDEIIMMPLYPQFSTTTTGSSFSDFIESLKRNNVDKKVRKIGCYPVDDDFIKAHVELILGSINKLKRKNNFRILFSAHGLPLKIIKSGDPYQWQVERSVEKITQALNIEGLDYKITYQSRVGPVQWLKPYTDKEIEIAGKEGKDLVVVPIAFVSEHVETLVELDIEYKDLAEKFNIDYVRVPTLAIHQKFIESMGNLIMNVTENKRICPKEFSKCICL